MSKNSIDPYYRLGTRFSRRSRVHCIIWRTVGVCVLGGYESGPTGANYYRFPNAKFHMTVPETRHSSSLKLVGSRLEKVVLFEYGMNDFRSLAKG